MKLKDRVALVRDISLEGIVNASDVVLVGGYSTAVLEVSALQKPVLILNVYNEVVHLPYAEMGIAAEVRNFGDLRMSVDELLSDQSARDKMLCKSEAFYESNKEFSDGKATERLRDLILELVEKHRGIK